MGQRQTQCSSDSAVKIPHVVTKFITKHTFENNVHLYFCSAIVEILSKSQKATDGKETNI